MSRDQYTSLDILSTTDWFNDHHMQKNRIKEIRILKGLTQETLAEKMGTTFATVGRHENGKRKLSDTWIRRYAEALGCHTSEIMGDAGNLALDEKEMELLQAFRGLDDSAKSMYLHGLRTYKDAAPASRPTPTKETEKKQEKKSS